MWIYQGKEFTSEDIGDHVAFVYEITNLINGRKYLGKKRFQKTPTKPPLKGKLRKRRVRTESDWKTYFGSNDELNEDVKKHGAENFKREILRLCENLTEASYWEAKHQFDSDALLSEDYYNAWIAVKVRRPPKEKL